MKRERRNASGAREPSLSNGSLPFDGCTAFEITVYECIRKIPSGETRSYAWVAQKIGKPKATRAVAQALKRNPWPLIIPCHRVISSDGDIGGYAYGIDLKRLLLSLEKESIL